MNGLDLVFTQVSLKVHRNLRNATTEALLLDYINVDFKVYLLTLILDEVKKVLLNLKYYSYIKVGVKYKLDRLLQLTILKVRIKLNQAPLFSTKKFGYNYSEIHWLLTHLENEDKELISLLIATDLWIQKKEVSSELGDFPPLLMMAILENFVLKLADIVVYLLLIQPEFQEVIINNEYINYLASINNQRNNIYWRAYIKELFLKPKYIYSQVYNLKVINSNGICNKIIYLPKYQLKEKKNLSKVQFSILLYIELIEFIYPKLERVVTFTFGIFTKAFRATFSG